VINLYDQFCIQRTQLLELQAEKKKISHVSKANEEQIREQGKQIRFKSKEIESKLDLLQQEMLTEGLKIPNDGK
jgi:hypothetical protein